jgi:transposase
MPLTRLTDHIKLKPEVGQELGKPVEVDPVVPLVKRIERKGAEAVIPPKRNRTEPSEYYEHLYKARILVERFINRIKQFRRVAIRYEKTARNYLAFIRVASIMVLLA